MKKNKEKAAVKESKKLAKKELTAQIISAFKSVAVNYEENKKIEKLIAKHAKKLSKQMISFPVKAKPSKVVTPPVKKSVKKEESLV